jgi:hypothetical protein
LVAQVDLGKRRDEGNDGAPDVTFGSATQDKHEAGTGPKRIDDVIQVILEIAAVGDQAQPTRSIDLGDFQFVYHVVPEQEPLLDQSRTDVQATWRQQLHSFDRAQHLRPFSDCRDRRENSRRASRDDPGDIDLQCHSPSGFGSAEASGAARNGPLDTSGCVASP